MTRDDAIWHGGPEPCKEGPPLVSPTYFKRPPNISQSEKIAITVVEWISAFKEHLAGEGLSEILSTSSFPNLSVEMCLSATSDSVCSSPFIFFSTPGLEGIFCGEARSGEENFCVFASIVGRACRAQLLQTFSRSCSLVSLFSRPKVCETNPLEFF